MYIYKLTLTNVSGKNPINLRISFQEVSEGPRNYSTSKRTSIFGSKLYSYQLEDANTHLSFSLGKRKKCRFAIFTFTMQPGAAHQRVICPSMLQHDTIDVCDNATDYFFQIPQAERRQL